MLTGFFLRGGVNRSGEDRLVRFIRMGKKFSGRIADERMAEKFEPATVFCRLHPDTVGRGDIDTIGNRVAALDGLPCLPLRLAIFGFFRRVPANGGGVKNHVAALHCGQARGFGEPLIPADKHTNTAIAGIEIFEAQIPRCEIKFLVIARVIRNMHFAVDAKQRTVRIQHCGRIMIHPRGAALKQRGDNHHLQFFRKRAKMLRCRAGNRLGQIKKIMILRLAEIRAKKQLGQTGHLDALCRRLAQHGFSTRHIFSGRWLHGHLHNADFVGCSSHGTGG